MIHTKLQWWKKSKCKNHFASFEKCASPLIASKLISFISDTSQPRIPWEPIPPVELTPSQARRAAHRWSSVSSSSVSSWYALFQDCSWERPPSTTISNLGTTLENSCSDPCQNLTPVRWKKIEISSLSKQMINLRLVLSNLKKSPIEIWRRTRFYSGRFYDFKKQNLRFYNNPNSSFNTRPLLVGFLLVDTELHYLKESFDFFHHLKQVKD